MEFFEYPVVSANLLIKLTLLDWLRNENVRIGGYGEHRKDLNRYSEAPLDGEGDGGEGNAAE
jgi:hypothetical protein